MKKWLVRSGWMAAGIAALYAVSAFAGAALGGPLDPPGPPGSTMQTIDSIPPSWFRMLSATDGPIPCDTARFKCVMGAFAVLDMETGLVWQAQANNGAPDLADGLAYCRNLSIENRKGWRVPTAPELASLIHMAGTSGKVPDGNPFSGIMVSSGSPPVYPYWTTTPDSLTPGNVTVVQFVDGSLQGWSPTPGTPGSVAQEQVWCVRAGENP